MSSRRCFALLALGSLVPARALADASTPSAAADAPVPQVLRDFSGAIDRRHGLVEVLYTGASESDDPPLLRDRRWCGPALTQRMSKLAREVSELVRTADSIECRGTAKVTCKLYVAGEFAASDELSFREVAGRRVLESVLRYPSAYVAEAEERAFRGLLDEKVALARRTRCR
jgi:hypothetical protein